MADDVTGTSVSKTEVKLSSRKNVIPITSISDLGSVVSEIQNQLAVLIGRLEDDVSPEFKALMEGFVNKANEAEELKVNLENISSKCEKLKSEISQIRETNRNLIHELQVTKDVLKNLEQELSTFQENSKKQEHEYKDKIAKLTRQNEDYEKKIKQELETKIQELTETTEKTRQEMLDQKFSFRQIEQELINERDNLKKQVDEFDVILNDQREQLELKTKEAEYKDALLNQLIKQTTSEKFKDIKGQNLEPENNTIEEQPKKGIFWFLKGNK